MQYVFWVWVQARVYWTAHTLNLIVLFLETEHPVGLRLSRIISILKSATPSGDKRGSAEPDQTIPDLLSLALF